VHEIPGNFCKHLACVERVSFTKQRQMALGGGLAEKEGQVNHALVFLINRPFLYREKLFKN